jgi:hypothetical protein
MALMENYHQAGASMERAALAEKYGQAADYQPSYPSEPYQAHGGYQPSQMPTPQHQPSQAPTDSQAPQYSQEDQRRMDELLMQYHQDRANQAALASASQQDADDKYVQEYYDNWKSQQTQKPPSQPSQQAELEQLYQREAEAYKQAQDAQLKAAIEEQKLVQRELDQAIKMKQQTTPSMNDMSYKMGMKDYARDPYVNEWQAPNEVAHMSSVALQAQGHQLPPRPKQVIKPNPYGVSITQDPSMMNPSI